MLPEQKEIKLIELFKVCTKCGIPKLLNEFYEQERGRFNVQAICKLCSRILAKNWSRAHKKQKKIYDNIYYKTHKDKCDARSKKYILMHKEQKKIQRKKYCAIHRERDNANMRIYRKKRRKVDPKYRLNCSIRGAINKSLRGNKNGVHWEDLVGYTIEKLKKHLEKLFTKNMTWKNYGKAGWIIEHKIPIIVFNFTESKHKDFKKCWALKNLQPMWAGDNLKKGIKLTKHFQPSLLL